MALGIGGSTLVFGLANTLFLRPLAAHQPERLALIYTSYAGGLRWGSTSYPDYRDLRTDNGGVFSELSAERIAALSIGVEPFNERLYGAMVSLSYFRTLGANALLGRTFVGAEGEGSEDSTAIVLSHGLWQRSFGGEPGAIGRPLAVNGVPFNVIGVMPEGFRGVQCRLRPPVLGFPCQADTLLAPGSTFLKGRSLRSLFVLGRLADGVTLEQADSHLVEISKRLAATYTTSNGGISFTAIPAAEGSLHPMYRSAVRTLLGLSIRNRRLHPAGRLRQHLGAAARQGRGAPPGDRNPNRARLESEDADRTAVDRELGASPGRCRRRLGHRGLR